MLEQTKAELQTPREGRFSWALVWAALGSLAFLAAWLAPNHYLPWVSFHNEAFAFAALGAFCVALLWGGGPLVWDRAAVLLVAALVLLVWLQWGAALVAYHGDAAVSTLYLAGFGLAWWHGGNVQAGAGPGQGGRALAWFAGLLVLAALASVYIALQQWLGREAVIGLFVADQAPGARPYGNLAQPNHLATLVVMALVMGGVLRVQGLLTLWQWYVLAGLLTLGLVLAQSRAGWLSVLVVGGLFLWCGRREWGLGGRVAVWSWWGLLAGAVALWRPLNEAMLLGAVRSTSVSALGQDAARLTIWRQMLAAIGEAPWLGYGWRQTVVGQKAGAALVPGVTPTDYAHSVVLDVLLWLGLPMGLLLLGLLVRWLVVAFARLQGPAQFLLFAGAMPVCVHSMVEFPFAFAYFLFALGWMLGALGMLQGMQRPGGAVYVGRRGRRAAVVVVGLFLAVGAWAVADYVQAEEDHRVMRFEMRRVGRVPDGYEAPRLLLLNQLREMLELGRLQPYPGMSAAELERMRVANRSFEWATLHMRYVVALGLNGQPAQATTQLEGLRALYGLRSYEQACAFLVALREGQYPQLAAVRIPP
ncbi:MAG: hypothetical protein RL211_1948 [Pseudomonadota bacterium]|jgi:O-antigen ligase